MCEPQPQLRPLLLLSLQGPEKEMDAIQAKEEVKKAREEDEEEQLTGKFRQELLTGKLRRHDNHFSRFRRQGEL